MRLIDADKIAYTMLYKENWMTGTGVEKQGVWKDDIDKMPTIEAEPVRHGKWIWDDEGYHCSECFFHAYGNSLECLNGTYKYCPHCGATMEEINEDD